MIKWYFQKIHMTDEPHSNVLNMVVFKDKSILTKILEGQRFTGTLLQYSERFECHLKKKK